MSPDRFRKFRKEVQVVFQNVLGSVNPRWDVRKIVGEPVHNFMQLKHNTVTDTIVETLELVGLKAEDLKKYPHQFSSGRLQRVCIARSIICNPKLIFLDEAVSSLDMIVQSQIIELLCHLRDRLAAAYLFISHDVRLVAALCDSIYRIHEGTIVQHIFKNDETQHKTFHPVYSKLFEAVII